MSEKQTRNSENPEAKKLSGHNKMADLLKSMGIDASQVDTTSNNSTRVRTREILTNADGLKEASREATNEVNKDKGSSISFVCVVRDGSLKDANGKVKLDEKGKSIPRYKPATKKGYFVIDKVEEGGNTFFNVTRAVQYTETYKIADYSELS